MVAVVKSTVVTLTLLVAVAFAVLFLDRSTHADTHTHTGTTLPYCRKADVIYSVSSTEKKKETAVSSFALNIKQTLVKLESLL